MSAIRSRSWRWVAICAIAGIALSASMSARAQDEISRQHPLSLRLGIIVPSQAPFRSFSPLYGGGIEYRLPIPEGPKWYTSISVDFGYSERVDGVAVSIPAAINQVYTFSEHNGVQPYAGIAFVADTFRNDGASLSYRQPTVTRFGPGLILGINFERNLFWEARYEWPSKKFDDVGSMEGLRTYIGFRF